VSGILFSAIPMFIRTPMDTDGTVDGVMLVQHATSVVLTCEGHAAPTPDITWTRNGVVLTNTSNINIVTDTISVSQRSRLSTLIVSIFTVVEEGNYICSANNSVGSIVTSGLALSKCCCVAKLCIPLMNHYFSCNFKVYIVTNIVFLL